MVYGDYSATIEAEGYTTKTESLAFRSNHKNFTATLESASQTGTVTVTAQDSEDTKVEGALVMLCDTDVHPSGQTGDSNIVGYGVTGDDGETILKVYDSTTHQPTESSDIPFDDYYLFADTQTLSYAGTLTVDGDETVTITLAPIEEGDD